MDKKPFQVAHISQIEARHFDKGGRARTPVREYFDIGAFGVNLFTTAAVGHALVEVHDELAYDGHEELYFVSAGRAVFTVNGEEVDAPAGTLLFVRDPAATRSAVTAAPDTTVLIVGGPRGQAYRVGSWEYSSVGLWRSERNDYEGALAAFRQGLDEYPGDAGLLYNLACVESLEGHKDAAMSHLREALARNPEGVALWADGDADLDPIRGEEGFPL